MDKEITGVVMGAVIVFMLGLLTGTCATSTHERGAEQTHCYPNKTCDQSLTCLSDICVKVPK